MTDETLDRRWLHRRTVWIYEPLRRFFEDRERAHQDLRADLNGARMGITVDEYLARSAVLSVLVAIASSLVGISVAVVLSTSGSVPAVFGQTADGTGVLGSVRTVAFAVLLASICAVAGGTLTWYVRYTLPGRRARRRARKLNYMLPFGMTYMYALSRGGLGIIEIFRRLARAESTYGELAQEAGLVVNQMDYLGQDFLQALRTASEVTPCRYTSSFYTDLQGVIESGGDIEEFLAARREDARQDARIVQEGYIENVSLFAEVYVTLVIAGSLFALILLIVLGITGVETLPEVNLLVYVGIPGASVIALLVLDRMASPFTQTSTTPGRRRESNGDVPDLPAAQQYAQRKRRFERRRPLREPVRTVVERPVRVLAVSIPVAAVLVGLVVATGTVEASRGALYESPLVATTLLVVVPFVVATGPLAIAVEVRDRRIDVILDRFPDVISSIASANRMGMRPAAAIAAAAEQSEHGLTGELQQLHNEIEWYDDLRGTLLRLARRARTRVTTRALVLIAEADEASGNLSETLAVVADDARKQREFLRERSQELSSYVAAAVISYLVFLGILLIINQFYFEQALAISQQGTPDNPALPISLQSLDAAGFQLAFLHSALVQALFIGLVAGKMTSGRAMSGLTYSLGLIVLTVAVFGVV